MLAGEVYSPFDKELMVWHQAALRLVEQYNRETFSDCCPKNETRADCCRIHTPPYGYSLRFYATSVL